MLVTLFIVILIYFFTSRLPQFLLIFQKYFHCITFYFINRKPTVLRSTRAVSWRTFATSYHSYLAPTLTRLLCLPIAVLPSRLGWIPPSTVPSHPLLRTGTIMRLLLPLTCPPHAPLPTCWLIPLHQHPP